MSTSTSAPPTANERRLTRRRLLDGVSLLAVGAALLLIFARGIFGATPPEEPRPVHANSLAAARAPTATISASPSVTPTATLAPTVTPTFTPEPTPTPSPPLVAIIAGHRNNDSGAICESGPYQGLQEVQVTTEVTAQLVRLLEGKGYVVLDLDEFDERLTGLQADALLSIHVDSCVDWEGTTGYKVARADNSYIPEVEDRFVACLKDEYGQATGLPRHEGSITHNMTLYHAFRKVELNTPAIIIELGFLYHDHHTLTARQEVMAEGLARGITCFLKQQGRAPYLR